MSELRCLLWFGGCNSVFSGKQRGVDVLAARNVDHGSYRDYIGTLFKG